MNLTRTIAWNMSVLMAGKAVVALMGLLSVALLTRYLGITHFGYYRTVLVYLNFAAIVTELGVYLITLREISNEGADQARILGNALSMRLAVTGLILLIAALISLSLPYEEVVRQGILIGTLSYTAAAGHHLLLVVFQLKLQQWQASLAEIIGATLMLACVWFIIQAEAGVVAAVGAMVAGNVTMFVCSWFLAKRLVPFCLRLDWAEWKRIAVAALPLAGSELLRLIHLRADSLLLSLLKPAADVGIYGVAYKPFETIAVLPLLFAGLMMPFFSQHAFQDHVQFRRYLSAAFDVSAIGAVGVVIVVFTFAEDLVTLMGGDEFILAATAMKILSLAIAIVSLSTIFKFAVTALNKQRILLWGHGAGAVVGLTAYLLLIPPYSYVGAACGTALAEATVWGFSGTVVARATGGFPSLMTFAKALVAGALTLGLFRVLEASGISWVLNLLLGSMGYLLILVLLRAIPKNLFVAL
jgi:O-antigen/teichoic acid export membrane protein